MSEEKNVVNFYRTGGEYGCFSNFSKHPLHINDVKYDTSEHYFQCKKFEGTPFEEKVRLASSPGKSASEGRRRDYPLRKDWEKVKEDIMYDAVYAKFTQNKNIKKVLLSTGEKTIVEHTANDSYWGDGLDGSGKNRLGHILMKVRKELQLQQMNVKPE